MARDQATLIASLSASDRERLKASIPDKPLDRDGLRQFRREVRRVQNVTSARKSRAARKVQLEKVVAQLRHQLFDEIQARERLENYIASFLQQQ